MRVFLTGWRARAVLVCATVVPMIAAHASVAANAVDAMPPVTAAATEATGAAAAPGALTGTSVIDGLTSTMDQGVVSVMSDPTLSDGRLILKVVAKNRTQSASSFGPQNVTLLTAAGTPVKLMTLDQLVNEARAAAGGSDSRGARMSGHAGPIMGRDSAGRPDVSGYTGGNDNMAGIEPSQSRRTPGDDPRLQQQIANLNAAILHDVTIAPAAVAGGQIVTEKLKFGRKEAHDLRLVVEFNGERHEFNFASPPAR